MNSYKTILLILLKYKGLANEFIFESNIKISNTYN